MDFDKDIVSIQETRNLIADAKKAQNIYKTFSQEKVDMIIKAVAIAAEKEAVKLAKMACEETGFGIVLDKIIKNKFASKVVYDNIKDLKTVGIIHEDNANKIIEIAAPVGIIAVLIPSTNPTSTTIYKTLIALKSGNGIIISPHPNAKDCVIATADILIKAANSAGAPEGLIGCITSPTLEATNVLLKHRDTSLILATGGKAMVKAAYSSGTPAIGVGPGNTPAFIDKSANIILAVKRIIDSKTFDNGVICSSEQSIVVERSIKYKVLEELIKQGSYLLNEEESNKLAGFLSRPDKSLNPEIVGKSVEFIAKMANIDIPRDIKLLISEQSYVSRDNPYSREKLAPILAFYTVENVDEGVKLCIELLMNEGRGHTFSIHTEDEEIVKQFALRIPSSRVIVNSLSSLGGVGATTNLFPALTLGCGAIGGGSTSDNIGPFNLINIKRVAYGIKEIEELKESDNDKLSIQDEYLQIIINKVVQQLKLLNK